MAQPRLHRWAEAHRPLRLQELERAKDDHDPKALACSGVLVHRPGRRATPARLLLRLLSPDNLAERVCARCDYVHESQRVAPEKGP